MEAGEGMASTFMKEEVTEWVAFEPVSALIQLSAEFGYTTRQLDAETPCLCVPIPLIEAQSVHMCQVKNKSVPIFDKN